MKEVDEGAAIFSLDRNCCKHFGSILHIKAGRKKVQKRTWSTAAEIDSDHRISIFKAKGNIFKGN